MDRIALRARMASQATGTRWTTALGIRLLIHFARMRRIRAAIGRRLRVVSALATSATARRRYRRSRFLKLAREYTPAIAVDDIRGNRYFVSTSDTAVGRGLFLDGFFEYGNLDNVLGILAEHDIVPEQIVDVGANVGTATVDLLRRLPSATGVAFEPDHLNFALLTVNLATNGLLDRVRAHNAAVSDVDGTVTLELSPVNSGDHRIRLTSDAGRYSEEKWDVTTAPAHRLDTLVQRGEIEQGKSTLLWIDAQGHEAQVLAGASRLGQAATVVEFWPYGLRRANALEAFLLRVGSYETIIEITERPRLVQPKDLPALADRLDRTCSYTDLLLLPGT